MPRILLFALFAVFIAPDSARAQAFDARTALRSIGDLDGDGVRDLLVSNRDVTQRECVWAVSCKTGQILYRIDSGMTGDGFGRAMADIGDIDKDGVSDFVVGAIGARLTEILDDFEPFENAEFRLPLRRWEFVTSGYVSAFSGKTGKLLFQARNKTKVGAFGYSFVGVGDANGDGVPDFLVGNPFKCECTLHSGHDGALLMTLPSPNGPHPHDDFGASLANLGDVDGDGRDDWAVGAPQGEFATEGKHEGSSNPAGAVFIISGKDSRVLRTIQGEPDDLWFGGTLACVRTTSEGSVGVLAVAAPNHRLRVWSLADWSLRYESRDDGARKGWDWFVTSLDFVRDTNTHAATRLIFSDAEMSDSGPSMGYVELQPLGGAIAPKVRLRGGDVCALDDLDGDHITDVALLDVQAMRLTFSSGKDDSKLREIALVQRAPTRAATPPNQPTPR